MRARLLDLDHFVDSEGVGESEVLRFVLYKTSDLVSLGIGHRHDYVHDFEATRHET